MLFLLTFSEEPLEDEAEFEVVTEEDEGAGIHYFLYVGRKECDEEEEGCWGIGGVEGGLL